MLCPLDLKKPNSSGFAQDGISVPDVKNLEKDLHLSAGPQMSGFHMSPGLLSAWAGHSKQYAKAIFKYVAVKEMSGKWGGSIKQRASSAQLSSIEILHRTCVDQLQW